MTKTLHSIGRQHLNHALSLYSDLSPCVLCQVKAAAACTVCMITAGKLTSGMTSKRGMLFTMVQSKGWGSPMGISCISLLRQSHSPSTAVIRKATTFTPHLQNAQLVSSQHLCSAVVLLIMHDRHHIVEEGQHFCRNQCIRPPILQAQSEQDCRGQDSANGLGSSRPGDNQDT